MDREDLIVALGNLGYPLVVPSRPKITQGKVKEVLSALSRSADPRLIEGFPVILANCAHRGLKVDIQGSLSECRTNSQKR